jgi:hypothetical protein
MACPPAAVYCAVPMRRRMNHMNAFEELGITSVAQAPRERTTTRRVGEAVTTVVAGTALIACGIVGLALITVVVFVFTAPGP